MYTYFTLSVSVSEVHMVYIYRRQISSDSKVDPRAERVKHAFYGVGLPGNFFSDGPFAWCLSNVFLVLMLYAFC